MRHKDNKARPGAIASVAIALGVGIVTIALLVLNGSHAPVTSDISPEVSDGESSSDAGLPASSASDSSILDDSGVGRQAIPALERFQQATSPPKQLSKTVMIRPRERSSQVDQRRSGRPLTGPSDGDPEAIITDYLSSEAADLGFSEGDVENPVTLSRHRSRHNGVTHLYLRQRYSGLEVYGAESNFNIADDGRILSAHLGFIPEISAEITQSVPELSAEEAVIGVASYFQRAVPDRLEVLEEAGGIEQRTIFEGGELSRDPIPARLMWFPNTGGSTSLVWNTVVHFPEGDKWVDVNVDASTGEILTVANWVAHANYRAFPLPLENPDDGSRALITDPADPVASPYGWHDTNGVNGPEFTDTRGNNVSAQEDANADNAGGDRASGGPSLTFDFPLDLSGPPSSYEAASITNLFYWNNVLHDLHYHYGFDEAAGNFQVNNYGNGGAGGDAVQADSIDGSGTNNANFATPPDGQRPRMQMFVWEGVAGGISINTPASIAREIEGLQSGFGPQEGDAISGAVVLVNDGSPTPFKGCGPLVNVSSVQGNIALIERGGCNFIEKVWNAQNAGATAAIVMNDQPGEGLIRMTGTGYNITIPSFFISHEDGQLIRSQLQTGVTLTLGGQSFRDSALDNLVIIHEYGHGVSNRLTGGSANSSALSATQSRGMGEGWSDWWGLVLTAKQGDTAPQARAVGNYLLGQNATGPGIRPAPYSTDTSINPLTFGDLRTGQLSLPHGIGTVWCTALWEVYWNLVNAHGFDPDFYEGTGGNNLALQLVMDGLKLQPANPTYLDARDAILLADEINNGGANRDLLWAAFAKRGMGFSAYDGGSPSSLDIIEAFDLPDALDISPGSQEPFFSSGEPGGTFSPSSLIYTLENLGSSPLSWTAGPSAGWLTVSPSSGVLNGGQTATVTVSLNGDANSLPLGVYRGRVTFENLNNEAIQTREAALSVNRLAESLDTSSLSLFSGQPSWTPQSQVSVSGGDAARSGVISHNEVTSMQTTINGPDTLVFWWKVSSEEFYDYLNFYVNGVALHSISGEVEWQQISVDLPAGPNVVKWEYRKDFSVSEGADAGWVDGIVLARDQPPIITSPSTEDGLIGVPFTYQIEATENPATFASSALPPGLQFDSGTGLIHGTPTEVANITVTISAANGFGTGDGDLQIRIRDIATIPFTEDFESGVLSDVWLAGGTNSARNTVTSQHDPREGLSHFTMDSVGGEFSRNELTVALDASGRQNLLLTFWAREFADESHGPPPIPFSGGADFDGVAISDDGESWYEVKPLRGEVRGQYRLFAVSLDDEMARHGLSYGPALRLRFNHFDDDAIPADGFALDDIRLQSLIPTTTLEVTTGAGGTGRTFSGVANPFSWVSIVSNRDGFLGEVESDGAGNWSVEVGSLRGGLHLITASVFGLPLQIFPVQIEDDRPPSAITQELIPFQSDWKYLDDGSDQYGASPPFFSPFYDDSSWAESVARFGYGGDGEVTIVSDGGNPSNRHRATYFRKRFTYHAGDTSFERLLLSLYADDGASVYLNGSLIQRHQMPTGSLSGNTLASSATNGDNERRLYAYELDPALVIEGENVVAVGVHQRTVNSDDLGFDMRLALTRDWFLRGVELSGSMENFAPADIDGDGDPDLIYTDNREIYFQLNLGNNLLADPVSFDGSGYQQSFTADKPLISDLNRDGLPDVVAYSVNGGGIRTYLNTGGNYDSDDAFRREHRHDNFSARGTSLADLNGDGYEDLVYQFNNSGPTNETYGIWWRPNDQSGEWNNPIRITDVLPLSQIGGIVPADIDGDSDVDLVLNSFYGESISWLENTGSGNFGAEQELFTTNGSYAMDVKDLNGDGRPDLYFNDIGNRETFWHENLGGGSFGRKWTIQKGEAIIHTRLRDLDDDGDLDLLFGFWEFSDQVWYRENDGRGNFSPAQQFQRIEGGSITLEDIDIVDWNSDGSQDVILATRTLEQLVFLSKLGAGPRINSFTVDDNTVFSGGTVTLSWTTEGADAVSVAGQSVGADGSLEVTVGEEETEFTLIATNADGSSEQSITVFVPEPMFDGGTVVSEGIFTQFRDLASGDLDGDGLPELVIADLYTHKVAWLPNLGGGQFGSVNYFADTLLSPTEVEVDDFDRDGLNDIVVLSDNNFVGFYRNLGNAVFGEREDFSVSGSSYQMWSLDFVQDNAPDLVVTDNLTNNVFLNNGNGTFGGGVSIGFRGINDFALADVTGDGIRDFISVSNIFRVTPGTGPLTFDFNSGVNLINGGIVGSNSVHARDFTGDGEVDLLMAASYYVRLYRHLGFNQWNLEASVERYEGLENGDSVVGDFDLDGDLDVAVSIFETFDPGALFWLENDGRGTFSEPQILGEDLPKARDLHMADIDGDGKLDLIRPGQSGTIMVYRNISGRPDRPNLSSESDSGNLDDGVTGLTNPDFTGFADPGSTVMLRSTLDGILGTTTADGSGFWSVTTSKLSHGTHSISAVVNGGNPSSALEVVIDTIAETPSALKLTTETDTGVSSNDGVTMLQSPVVTGVSEAGATVQLESSIDGPIGSGVANAEFWIATANLTEGVHEIRARATDPAGNVSELSEPLVIEVDVTPPGSIGPPDLADSSDLGNSNSDNLTSDTTPTFSGVSSEGTEVQIYADGNLVGTGNGGSPYSVTVSELVDGIYNFTASETDDAGNPGPPSSALSVQIDATGPTVTITSPASTPAFSTEAESIALGGTATDASGLVGIAWQNSLGGSGVGNGTDSWSVPEVVLFPGTNVVTITATDEAGNEGDDTISVSYTPHVAETYEEWAASYQLTGADFPREAIPFGDGVKNLLKYAFNLNGGAIDQRVLERSTGTAGLPLVTIEGEGNNRVLRCEFLVRTDSELVYRPLFSANLQDWDPLPGTPDATSINVDWDRVVIEYPLETEDSRGFVRVEVYDTSDP